MTDHDAKIFGLIFLWGMSAAAGYGALWLWPEGITDVAVARLTIGMLLKAAGAVTLGFMCIGLFFGGIGVVAD
jgi:hypothetical protein